MSTNSFSLGALPACLQTGSNQVIEGHQGTERASLRVILILSWTPRRSTESGYSASGKRGFYLVSSPKLTIVETRGAKRSGVERGAMVPRNGVWSG